MLISLFSQKAFSFLSLKIIVWLVQIIGVGVPWVHFRLLMDAISDAL